MPRGRKPGMAWRSGDHETELVPEGESAFEKLVKKLKLEAGEYEASTQLRDFAKRHHRTHFVPEKLLETWGLVVND